VPAITIFAKFILVPINVVGVVDLYEHYQEWCRKNNVRPFASRPFTLQAKEEIEIALRLKYRHDLEAQNGRAKRALMEKNTGIPQKI